MYNFQQAIRHIQSCKQYKIDGGRNVMRNIYLLKAYT